MRDLKLERGPSGEGAGIDDPDRDAHRRVDRGTVEGV
jgi:hypothetical protein